MKSPLISLIAVAAMTAACSNSNPVAPAAPTAHRSLAPDENQGESSLLLAANPSQVFRSDIHWTMTRDQCPVLWSNSITGTGVRLLKVHIDSLGNGMSLISVTESVAGTATDEEQRQFRFAYASTHELRAGSSFTDTSTTTFNLIGLGGAAMRLQVGSTDLFRVDANGTVTLNESKTRGPEGCAVPAI